MEVGLDGLTSRSLGDAYKRLLRVHHPDAGGDHEAFVRLQQAKAVLLAWLDQRVPAAGTPVTATDCPRCKGQGFVTVVRGFTSLRQQCVCAANVDT